LTFWDLGDLTFFTGVALSSRTNFDFDVEYFKEMLSKSSAADAAEHERVGIVVVEIATKWSPIMRRKFILKLLCFYFTLVGL
jgi:hypothetical protein